MIIFTCTIRLYIICYLSFLSKLLIIKDKNMKMTTTKMIMQKIVEEEVV
jgi:hypothetical protein